MKHCLFLVQQFIDHYHHKQNRYVYLYGGSDGNRKNDAASRDSYFDDVRQQLTKARWDVQLRAELYEAHHMDKYQFWYKFLSGEYPTLPTFLINMNNAMETFVSMDNAPILPQEFKKDKSSERKKDQPRWKATDLSDAVDNLFYWLLSPLLGDQYPSNEMILLPGDRGASRLPSCFYIQFAIYVVSIHISVKKNEWCNCNFR